MPSNYTAWAAHCHHPDGMNTGKSAVYLVMTIDLLVIFGLWAYGLRREARNPPASSRPG
jgi:hypothetical protein